MPVQEVFLAGALEVFIVQQLAAIDLVEQRLVFVQRQLQLLMRELTPPIGTTQPDKT